MNIIIEGPDNSGKSTLVKTIASRTGMTIQAGEGPEKYPGEIVERTRRYLKLQGRLFDRHPAISQNIYGRFREGATMIPDELLQEFYSQGNLIIFCSSVDVGAHELKDYDTPTHVKMVEDNKQAIEEAYRFWAGVRADIRYQVGDDLELLFFAIREFINGRLQPRSRH